MLDASALYHHITCFYSKRQLFVLSVCAKPSRLGIIFISYYNMHSPVFDVDDKHDCSSQAIVPMTFTNNQILVDHLNWYFLAAFHGKKTIIVVGKEFQKRLADFRKLQEVSMWFCVVIA